MDPLKSPTIHDVAQRAGVSLSTVSRVLNDYASVSPHTRERVETAVRELHYERPKSVDDDKLIEAPHSVGLIVPDILNPFFPLLIKGVEQVSRIHGYHLILCDSENDLELETQHINNLYQRGVNGIILIPSRSESPIRELILSDFPLVLLDRMVESEAASYVISDNEDGAYQAVRYLLKLGHQWIVNLAGPQDLNTEKARLKGFQRALAEEGIPGQPELMLCGNYRLEEAYREVMTLLRRGVEFTAVFATNDMMAFGAKLALEEQGKRIPEDVSLVGYDDIQFSSIISLTTVSQPALEMGRNAMLLLLDLVKERIKIPQHIVLRPSMVIRGSCQRR
ncbi:transcriptional regulator, LacI family [Candidatus Vecturithrix granuli]|uniref:Transcriptional regulator, LacI family n=1 Tax=Vecturithrix granuli TaxID=1499967 RepID=A0A081C939_VECG1|nr:transcriptional regulator, LacI family [Candidatus Vecturithrix granuli]